MTEHIGGAREQLMTRIVTERLCLKQITSDYRDELVELIGDEDVAGVLSNVPFPYTGADADWYIEAVKSSPYALNIFREGKLVGGVSLMERESNLFELGYWIAIRYWGNGYATEACKGLLQHVAKRLSGSGIFAKVAQDNHYSKRVVEKLGFAETNAIPGLGGERNREKHLFHLALS